MALHLTVASGLAPLADELARLLTDAPTDPFTRDVVAVPGEGTKSWLVARLAERLGASGGLWPDGIVANVEFVFPATLVRRALGDDRNSGRWSVGPLTWAIYQELGDGAAEELGLALDAVRARAIADLFDRYGLHRPTMVHAWEAGHDVDVTGAALPEHVRWQPRLWRRLLHRLGEPSDVRRLALDTAALRAARIEPLLPDRVVLVGLSGLPSPHLDVLGALATRRELHVLAPAASIEVWRRVAGVAHELGESAVLRSGDPSAAAVAHPLAKTWGRASREAQLLLAAMAARQGVQARLVGGAGDDAGEPPLTLLARLKHDIAHDVAPPGRPTAGATDRRPELAADDASFQWHRCHGPVRQVEVLRDVIVRLLEEHDGPRPRFEPRDVAIVCPDVATFAPLVEAVFAGDPQHGVPQVPVRIADRSLRADSPLLDAVAHLLDLLEGRFRASDVLAFTARAAVRHRFGIKSDHLARFASWAASTNVRWGLDSPSRTEFGFPPNVVAHTWQAGLDQLLVGSTMPDETGALAIGDTPPHAGIESDDVDAVGMLADVVRQLGLAVRRLGGAQRVADWCDAVATSAHALCSLPEIDAWQWRDLDRALATMREDHELAGGDHGLTVPSAELAVLLSQLLEHGGGRARFGTGAVTVSSPTAQRGVPHRVVCLLGLDGELVAGTAAADDLAAAPPCVGDRDARSELRAQLLDAILAAGERLVVCTTGRDLRTNANVAPAVPVAELADLIDATVRVGAAQGSGSSGKASDRVAVDHPRQSWSEPNFWPGRLGVPTAWSFDRAARDAASTRREARPTLPVMGADLPPQPLTEVTVDELVEGLRNPVRALARARLGIFVAGDDERVSDLPELTTVGLGRWQVSDRLLAKVLAGGRRLAAGERDEWLRVEQAAGRLPPLAAGERSLNESLKAVTTILDAAEAEGVALDVPALTQVLDVAVGDCQVVGEITGVRGELLVELTASTLRARHRLATWVRLAALTCARPEVAWRAVTVGREKDRAKVIRLQMRSPEHARIALQSAVDLVGRVRCSVVPALAELTRALLDEGPDKAASDWRPSFAGAGGDNGNERYVRFMLGEVDFEELLGIPPRADEVGPEWGDAASRIERWAHRVWTMVESTTVPEQVEP